MSPPRPGPPHEGTTEGEQKKQPEMWTLRIGLTLLGKQKVGSLVPKWDLGEAKARCLSQVHFDMPASVTPKGGQLQLQTPDPQGVSGFPSLWANAQGILPIDVCFWDEGT